MEVICKKDVHMNVFEDIQCFTAGKSYITTWEINRDYLFGFKFELITEDDTSDNHGIAYSDDKDTSDDEWFNEYFDVI